MQFASLPQYDIDEVMLFYSYWLFDSCVWKINILNPEQMINK